MMNRIIIAIDSFKGCLPSAEANKAAAEGIGQWPNIEVVQIPVSDGGEGWLQAFLNAKGGETVDVTVRDALMRPIVAQYLIQGDTAVVEMARASGLTLLTPEERNPMLTTTYGTGQLVADAVRRGCRNMVVGLGGSATSDCGIGMLRAIIDAFAPGGTWDDVRALNDIHFTIATDVANPLCGSQGAAHVFAPQKGASPHDVEVLDARSRRFADLSARHFGYDRQNHPGAGAAGGLGYAFLQYLHAECRSGIDLLLDAIGFLWHSATCAPSSCPRLPDSWSHCRPSVVACRRFRPCGKHQSPHFVLRRSDASRRFQAEHSYTGRENLYKKTPISEKMIIFAG